MEDSPEFNLIEQPNFKHDPLSSPSRNFRLVKLLSRTPDGIIKCSLQEFSIVTPPVYTALSYEWGSLENLAWIEVNDIRFKITENLHSFLNELYCNEIANLELLFVDAICIDQTNLKERNEQVMQMDQVYSKSTQMRMWLGQGAEGSDKLFRFFDTPDPSTTWPKIPEPLRGLYPKERVLTEFSESCGDDDPQYLAIRDPLRALMRRSYWTRAWIVQEIVLSSTIVIHCGQSLVDWDRFSTCCDYFIKTLFIGDENSGETGSYNYQYILDTKRRSSSFPSRRSDQSCESFDMDDKPTLFYLIQNHNRTECSDARDRIYSLLGLAKEGDKLRADYSQSALAVFLNVLAINAAPKRQLLVYCLFIHRVLPLHWPVTKAQISYEVALHAIPSFDTAAFFVTAGFIAELVVSGIVNQAGLFCFKFKPSEVRLPEFGYSPPQDKFCYSTIKFSHGDWILQSIDSNCAFVFRPSRYDVDVTMWTYLGIAVLGTPETIRDARVVLDEELDICKVLKSISLDGLLDLSKERGLSLTMILNTADVVRVGLMCDEVLLSRKPVVPVTFSRDWLV